MKKFREIFFNCLEMIRKFQGDGPKASLGNNRAENNQFNRLLYLKSSNFLWNFRTLRMKTCIVTLKIEKPDNNTPSDQRKLLLQRSIEERPIPHTPKMNPTGRPSLSKTTHLLYHTIHPNTSSSVTFPNSVKK